MDKREIENLKKRLDDIKKIKSTTLDEAACLFMEVNGIRQRLAEAENSKLLKRCAVRLWRLKSKFRYARRRPSLLFNKEFLGWDCRSHKHRLKFSGLTLKDFEPYIKSVRGKKKAGNAL